MNNDRLRFRVWDKRKNTYTRDFVFNFINKVPYITVEYFDDEYAYTHTFEEDEIIIEQCTGLKDKNGKLIYEGDIIKENNTIHFIRWDNLDGRFRAQTPNKSIDCGIGFDWVDHKEIIGNIHENPELLEG